MVCFATENSFNSKGKKKALANSMLRNCNFWEEKFSQYSVGRGLAGGDTTNDLSGVVWA